MLHDYSTIQHESPPSESELWTRWMRVIRDTGWCGELSGVDGVMDVVVDVTECERDGARALLKSTASCCGSFAALTTANICVKLDVVSGRRGIRLAEEGAYS